MTTQTTEVPRRAASDSVIIWSQPLVTTGLLVMSVISVRPVGGAGRGAYVGTLIGLCAAHAYSRSIPDRWVSDRARLVAAAAGVVAAGLLFGAASNSWAVSFAYVVSGHVGFRFEARIAIGLAAMTSIVALVALEAGPHIGGDSWSWWTALTVAGPVVTGLARQERERTLANARELVTQTRRAAASEAEASALAERNRIARELHDVLAHSLSGVSLKLDTADALLEAGRTDEARQGLQQARELVVDGLVQARDAVRTLRDDELDLADALKQTVQGDERLVVEGPVETVEAPVARAALRIVQEALTNARRHAPGATTTVTVRAAETLTLEVVNDAPAQRAAPFEHGSGLGLVGIQERVAALGGSAEAGPTPGGGWHVTVEVPA